MEHYFRGYSASPADLAGSAVYRQPRNLLWEVPLDTPLGRLWLRFSDQGLQQLRFTQPGPPSLASVATAPLFRGQGPPAITRTVRALQDYFAGINRDFRDLCLDPQGTPFQRRVWETARQIAFGTTVTYGTLARRLGLPHGARAVGGALRANQLPIIIPCHRVVGANGALGGFSAGLQVKRWLLAHEQAVLASGLSSE